jgi:hypothetical protein
VAEAADLGADHVVVAVGASGDATTRAKLESTVVVRTGWRQVRGHPEPLSATMSVAPIMHIMSTSLRQVLLRLSEASDYASVRTS